MTVIHSKTKSLLLPVTVLLTLVVAVVIWQLTGSSPAAAGSTQALAKPTAAVPAAATSAKSAGGTSSFGFSAAVQAKIDRLNAELDRCLVSNGAERLPLGATGWTYTDPGGRPSAACAAVQNRINAYANSAEMRAAVAAVLPAVEARRACLERQGVPLVSHGSLTAVEKAAIAKAHIACGGSATDAIPAG